MATGQGRSRTIRPMLDVAMALLFLLQMAPYQTGGWYHELSGLCLLLLMVVHHVLNKRWLRAELKRKSWLPLILNAALTLCLLAVALSGMTMAQHLTLVRRGSLAHAARPLHACFTYLGLMLVSLHTGTHLPMVGRLVRFGDGRGAASTILRTLCMVCLLAMGIYEFIRLDVATKLVWGVSFPDGIASLPMMVARHVLLAIPFVLLGARVAPQREMGVT